MANLELIQQAQRIAFRARERNLQAFELLAIHWQPDQPTWYCNTQLDQILNADQAAALRARLGGRPIVTGLMGGAFRTLPRSGDIADDVVSIELWDGDGSTTERFLEAGEGVRVQLFYYFPEFDLMPEQFWGHLRVPDDNDGFSFKSKVASGFRSPLLKLPKRAFYRSCAAIFGGLINDLQELLDNDCPYDLHLGGSVGLLNPATSQPFTSCPRNNRAACIARLGDDLSYLAFDVVIEAKTVTQTKGPNLSATTRGNSSNLSRPLRVIYGHRIVKDLDLLAYRAEPNTKHPDKAALSTLFCVSEGPVQSILNVIVKGLYVKWDNLQVRLGHRRQAASGFSVSVPNYSGTAHFYSDVIGDWRGIQGSDIDGQCEVFGRNTVRVYSDAATFSEQYTTNRAWCLFDLYRNKRYGHGLDPRRFVVEDWIELAAWCDQFVGYSDPNGDFYASVRSTFNADLADRTAQQQIRDTCAAGRFAIPFPHNGSLRIVPLSKVAIDDSIPTFSDFGEERNITVDGAKSSLTWSQKSDAELPNKVILKFDDEAYGFVETPLVFEDQEQQLRAGRAYGDNTLREVSKELTAFGVTQFGEAVRLGNLALDLGEFDEGGLKNNLRVKFTTWSLLADVLELHPSKVIRVRSAKLSRFPFEYFRIIKLERQANLQMRIEAQAYPVDYYDRLENVVLPPPLPGSGGVGNPGGGSGDRPRGFGFGDVDTGFDEIRFRLLLN